LQNQIDSGLIVNIRSLLEKLYPDIKFETEVNKTGTLWVYLSKIFDGTIYYVKLSFSPYIFNTSVAKNLISVSLDDAVWKLRKKSGDPQFIDFNPSSRYFRRYERKILKW